MELGRLIIYHDSSNMPGVKTSSTNNITVRKLKRYTMIIIERSVSICHNAYFHSADL
jgi:hypothetical protein